MNKFDVNVLKKIFNTHSTRTLVEKPCIITHVHSPYLVDVEYFDNNKSDILYKVPVKHIQTKKAFVFLTLRVGDRGTVRFLDNDLNNYLAGDNIESSEVKKHSINDGIFCLGFYPNSEQYILPEGDVSVGNTDGTIITINDNTIKIYGEDITVEGNDLTIKESNIKVKCSELTVDESDMTVNGGDISVTGGEIQVNSSTVSVTSGQVDISGSAVSIGANTQIDGRNFLNHVHREVGSLQNVPFTGGVI